MGTMKGWETRRRTKLEQEEFIIAKAYRHGYQEGRQSLADLLGQLQAIAVTAERLCRYDGSKAMSQHGHFYDAAKAYEYSERLHELLAEWRKGQKEGRWSDTTQPARDAGQS